LLAFSILIKAELTLTSPNISEFMFIKDVMRDCMSKKKKTKRERRKLRDKIDPDEESLLSQIELDLYLECMELDKKRKRRDYIV